MAYVSYSPVRDFHGVRSVVAAPIVFRSALVAIAAAGAILALSEANVTNAAATATAAKGDRVAAVSSSELGAASVGYYVDDAARTTTVERGAATPLAADSPFAGQDR